LKNVLVARRTLVRLSSGAAVAATCLPGIATALS